MFRIVCFVEDKHLPKILHAMSGLVLNMEPPQPVVNAVVKKGKVETSSMGDSVLARIKNLISSKLAKGDEFTSDTLKLMVKDAGGNVASTGTYRSRLVEDKTIKLKERGVYTVL